MVSEVKDRVKSLRRSHDHYFHGGVDPLYTRDS